MLRTPGAMLVVLTLLAGGPAAAGECSSLPTVAEQSRCLEARIARLEAELGRLGEELPAAGLAHPEGLEALIEQKLEEALQKPRLQPLQ